MSASKNKSCKECIHKDLCMEDLNATLIATGFSVPKGHVYDSSRCTHYLDGSDLVKVTRCADCRYHDGDTTDEGRFFIYCTEFGDIEVAEDFFCGCGKPEVEASGKV